MPTTKIMVIRHAERPRHKNNEFGVDPTGQSCGIAANKHLSVQGWQRAGALITLFVPPWGPKAHLATPATLFASNPVAGATPNSDAVEDVPSQRPAETLGPLQKRLGLPSGVNTTFSKVNYAAMVTDALASDGVVLIAWQHKDIPFIGSEVLRQTKTPDGSVAVPAQWPVGSATQDSRYDLVWVFDRSDPIGPIESFTTIAQMLLFGDQP
ncbi:MAG: hypothetical protein WB609_02070 [Candidatus Cybelea sp.]